MKRVVRYTSILDIMLCTLGFMTGVYADNEQEAVSSVVVEEQLADISDRLSEVEKLRKDELIEELLQNQRDITDHSTSEITFIGILVAIVAMGIATFRMIGKYGATGATSGVQRNSIINP